MSAGFPAFWDGQASMRENQKSLLPVHFISINNDINSHAIQSLQSQVKDSLNFSKAPNTFGDDILERSWIISCSKIKTISMKIVYDFGHQSIYKSIKRKYCIYVSTIRLFWAYQIMVRIFRFTRFNLNWKPWIHITFTNQMVSDWPFGSTYCISMHASTHQLCILFINANGQNRVVNLRSYHNKLSPCQYVVFFSFSSFGSSASHS